MIKISDKIWYVVKLDHEDNLAYMCGMIKIFDMGVGKLSEKGFYEIY